MALALIPAEAEELSHQLNDPRGGDALDIAVVDVEHLHKFGDGALGGPGDGDVTNAGDEPRPASHGHHGQVAGPGVAETLGIGPAKGLNGGIDLTRCHGSLIQMYYKASTPVPKSKGLVCRVRVGLGRAEVRSIGFG